MQSNAIELQADAIELQPDAIQLQADAIELQPDAIKWPLDAIELQPDAIAYSVVRASCSLLNTSERDARTTNLLGI